MLFFLHLVLDVGLHVAAVARLISSALQQQGPYYGQGNQLHENWLLEEEGFGEMGISFMRTAHFRKNAP